MISSDMKRWFVIFFAEAAQDIFRFLQADRSIANRTS